mmetsp:Transcript_72712/g.157796  ORF Transcript_72712/g.157796 Transcript_72712/m.157796 type:complete len:322 (+) Transcript_72712:1095-2060(+)
MVPSTAVAALFISSAGISEFLEMGFISTSALSRMASADTSSSFASSATFVTASFCSSRIFLFSSSSARFCRACFSDLAMATIPRMRWNFSNVIGSKTFMIFSIISADTSKLYSLLPKSSMSLRLSFPPPVVLVLAKRSFLTSNFFRALAFFVAFSLTVRTDAKSLSIVRLPPVSVARRSASSLLTFREASLSPISSSFSSTALVAASTTSLHPTTIFSVESAVSTIFSGVTSESPFSTFAVSSASLTLPSAFSTSPSTSFMILSTFSASSFLFLSSSIRAASSAARFSLISSMRCCACCNAFSASWETFSACEPMDSRCSA